MSTRYVWSKGSTGYVDGIPDLLAGTGLANTGGWYERIGYIPKGTLGGGMTSEIDMPQCWSSYTFNELTGEYTGSGSYKDLTPEIATGMNPGVDIQNPAAAGRLYPYIISKDRKSVYLWSKSNTQPFVTSSDTVYWTYYVHGKNSSNTGSLASANNCVCVSILSQSSSQYDYYALEFYKVNATTSSSTSRVSSDSKNAYPDGGEYTYLGADDIDPISISYPTSGISSGDNITVKVTPSSYNTFGGTISYLYQYNTGSGWVTIQTTSATSIQFAIPSNASSIQFRVRAQDSWGFTSNDYVTGPKVTLDGGAGGGGTGRVWVGVVNTARQATGVWVGVNGVAKKVTAMWVGVNGIAKKVF